MRANAAVPVAVSTWYPRGLRPHGLWICRQRQWSLQWFYHGFKSTDQTRQL